MAHKKAGGKTKNGRDSHSKRLGVKCFGGQYVKSGAIIIRQRGTSFYPGQNVKLGKDHSLFATSFGYIVFKKIKFQLKHKNVVYVLPEARVFKN